jgi:gas vesicle protein
MDWLSKLVPLLGTALGGPLGGAAASFIADKLGIESKTIEAVTDVLNSGKLSPDQIAAIKVAEIDFQKFLEQNKIDLVKMDFDNTKSARDMQIITKSTTPAIMSYLITAGFFGILTYMLSDAYVSSEPLLVMLGSLGTAWIAVVNYWFGSSHGSAQKSEILASKG